MPSCVKIPKLTVFICNQSKLHTVVNCFFRIWADSSEWWDRWTEYLHPLNRQKYTFLNVRKHQVPEQPSIKRQRSGGLSAGTHAIPAMVACRSVLWASMQWTDFCYQGGGIHCWTENSAATTAALPVTIGNWRLHRLKRIQMEAPPQSGVPYLEEITRLQSEPHFRHRWRFIWKWRTSWNRCKAFVLSDSTE